MATYTVELNEVVKSGSNLFDFEYDFYDPTKKKDFERKFINHFFFREIGCETLGRFKHNLRCTMEEKFPYYNMLLMSSLIAYEKTINYNLSETFTRDNNKVNSLTGTGNTSGTNTNNTDLQNTLDRTNETLLTGEQSNTVVLNGANSSTSDSEVELQTDTEYITTNEISEKILLNKTATRDNDNKKVGSDTPSGLLTMPDIAGNVYASTATIDDNTESIVALDDTLTQRTTTNNDKTGVTGNDKTTRTTTGTVDDTTTTTGNSTNTQDDTIKEKNIGSTRGDGSFESVNSSLQNATETGIENYTKIMKGSFGVITEADMIQKHINLQKTLTTIYTQFFNECDDLFMGIY